MLIYSLFSRVFDRNQVNLLGGKGEISKTCQIRFLVFRCRLSVNVSLKSAASWVPFEAQTCEFTSCGSHSTQTAPGFIQTQTESRFSRWTTKGTEPQSGFTVTRLKRTKPGRINNHVGLFLKPEVSAAAHVTDEPLVLIRELRLINTNAG